MSNAKKTTATKTETKVTAKKAAPVKKAALVKKEAPVKKETSAKKEAPAKKEVKIAPQFTGSKSAIRNTMRRHEEIGETSPTEFFDIKSKIAVVLGAAEIVVKNGEATIGTLEYGKEQFKRTATLVNDNGGAFVFRGAGKKSNGGVAVNASATSLKTVLTNNGFAPNKEGLMEKDGHTVTLSNDGWIVSKAGKEIISGSYGRGTIKAIKNSMIKKVA